MNTRRKKGDRKEREKELDQATRRHGAISGKPMTDEPDSNGGKKAGPGRGGDTHQAWPGAQPGRPKRDVARDRHVKGRVGEQHLHLVGPEQMGVGLRLQCVAAEQATLAKNPEITLLGHRGGTVLDLRQGVFLIDATAVQKKVDLAHLEAADFKVDLRGQFQDRYARGRPLGLPLTPGANVPRLVRPAWGGGRAWPSLRSLGKPDHGI